MVALDSILLAIVHHTVSDEKLRLDIDNMVSQTTWTEALASSEGQLEQLRALGNWVLYSSFVHHVLPAIPLHPPAFFEVRIHSILHSSSN